MRKLTLLGVNQPIFPITVQEYNFVLECCKTLLSDMDGFNGSL